MSAPNQPKISIVMVDGSFREYFHAIRFFGRQTLPPEDYELIWVEYYDQVHPQLAENMAQHPNFRHVTLNRDGLYHSSYCFNEGIRASRGELIIIPDADVVVEEDFLETVWQEHQQNDELVMYFYRFDEPESAHRDDWDLAHLQETCTLQYVYNYGACLTVRKKWLLAINGYEQHPVFGSGLHANGQDIYTRLLNLGLHVKWHPEIRIYHPWHPRPSSGAGAYDVQRAFLSFRALSLRTQAYDGLDPTQKSDPPHELVSDLQNMANRLRRRGDGALGQLSYYIKTFFGILKQHWGRTPPPNAYLQRTDASR